MDLALNNQLFDPFLTPATLAMSLWPSGKTRWIPQPHLLHISAKFAHAAMKGDSRNIVSVPPRHGKTLIVTDSGIPWYLEKFPDCNIMFISYNQDFAEEQGMRVKDTIASRPDLFSYRIKSGRDRVDRFETDRGNTVWFGGIDGGLTGKGAHLVIIDDYIKNFAQAASKTERDNMYTKFVANIFTRLEPGCSLFIVATRWWSDDLIGRIIKNLRGWDNTVFPGVYLPTIGGRDGPPDIEARDLIGRKYGEVLFPQRHPISRMNELQEAMNVSSTIFEALIQQTPIDDQTTFTDKAWLKTIPHVDMSGMTLVRAWDMASKQGGGDWTVGTKMGRRGQTRPAYIFNVVRGQLSPMKVEETIRSTAVADGIDCTVILEVEGGSAGAHLFHHYKTNVLPEFTVVGSPAGNKSKVIKAQPFIAAAQSGNIFFVDSAYHPSVELPKWITVYGDEFHAFPPPSGGNDDQIDTGAMGYNHLFKGERVSPTWGRDMEEQILRLRAAGVATGPHYVPGSQIIDPRLDAVFASTVSDKTSLIKGVCW
jgi:hypothetical protein